MLNYNKLRYFVTAAEQLNFTRAAEQLFIGQPALSAHMKDLEREFGVDLFVRGRRTLALTAAGQKLYDLVAPCFPDEDALIREVRRAAFETRPVLTVGVLGTRILDHLPDVVGKFREKYPDVQVNLVRLPEKQLTRALSDGSVDVGFQFTSQEDSDDMLRYPVMRGSMLVAMHHDNPLAGRERLQLADLAGQPIAVLDPEQDSLYAKFEEGCLRGGGFVPNIVAEYTYMEPMLSLIGMGEAVAIVSTLALPATSSNVCYRPLDGLPDNEICLVWPESAGGDPAVAAFVRHVKEYPFTPAAPQYSQNT